MSFTARKKITAAEYFTGRTKYFAIGSMLTNLVAGVIKIIVSAVTFSFYLGFNGIFNAVLGFAKLHALRKYKIAHKPENAEFKAGIENVCIKRISSCAIAAAIIHLSFSVVCTFFFEDKAAYGVSLACFIAASAFCKLILNITGSHKIGKTDNSVIIRYIKLTNVIDALIGVALTQRALLYMMEEPGANFYSGIGGIVFSVLALAVSVIMLAAARKKSGFAALPSSGNSRK